MPSMLQQERQEPKFVDVQVERRGNTIVLPEGMTTPTAIDWLERREEEASRFVDVEEELQGFPLDCAYALQLAVQERYGFKELRTIPASFFTPKQPPRFVVIPTDDHGGVTEVFLGRFSVPGMGRDSYLETHPAQFDGLTVYGSVMAKELPEVKALVALARTKLKTNSLYKGNAISIDWIMKSSWMGDAEGFDAPAFMPPPPPNTQLLVNDDTMEIIKASIWYMIEHTAWVRKLGVPLKRSFLAEGPFGTGKTLLAAITAQLCKRFGWTFIYLRDVRHLKEAYLMAARYSPSLLFAEDLDQLMAVNQGHDIQNVLDGIDTKGAEVMLGLTTNYVEKLDTSILRNGRIDALIPFREPDAITAQKLVRHYAGTLLAASEDLSRVGEKLDGLKPASIREVVERAKLFAMADGQPGEPVVLTATAILRSAISMHYHLEVLEKQMPKPKKSGMEQMGAAFGEEFGKWLTFAIDRAQRGDGYWEKHQQELAKIEAGLTRNGQ